MPASRDSRGFSLIAIIAMVGISSVVILGLYTAVAEVIKSQAMLKHLDKARTYTDKLAMLLTQKTYCSSTFSGVTLSEASLKDYQDVDIRFHEIQADLSPGPVFAQPGQELANGLKLTQFQLQADMPIGNDVFVGSLRIAFENPHGSTVKLFTQEIPLTLEMPLAGGERSVSSCRAGREGLEGGGGPKGSHSAGNYYGQCAVQHLKKATRPNPTESGQIHPLGVSNDGFSFKSIHKYEVDHTSAAEAPFKKCDIHRNRAHGAPIFSIECQSGYRLVYGNESNTASIIITTYKCEKL